MQNNTPLLSRPALQKNKEKNFAAARGMGLRQNEKLLFKKFQKSIVNTRAVRIRSGSVVLLNVLECRLTY